MVDKLIGLKVFLDAELAKAEVNHQATLKRHSEIMAACNRMMRYHK